MFLLISRYVKPLDEADRWLPEHRAFLDRHYAANTFVVSGRFEPRTGGVIVTADLDRATLDRILEEDPFLREGIAEYEIQEFIPTKMHEVLKPLLAP